MARRRGRCGDAGMDSWAKRHDGQALCNTLFFGKNKNLKNYLFSLIIMFIAFMLLHIFILMDV
jgi:hypothetical protein